MDNGNITGKIRGKGKNPNSQKALEPTKWKKGEAVPGAGRPKGSLSLKERLQTFLDVDVKIKMPDGTITDKTVLDSIIISLVSQAQKGNIKAIQEIFDRNFGKEPETINLMKHEDRLDFL